MEIKVKTTHSGRYKEVTIQEEQTQISLGLLSAEQAKDLARTFALAIVELVE